MKMAQVLVDRLKGCAGQLTHERHGEPVRNAAADVLLETDHYDVARAMIALILSLEEEAEAAKKALTAARAALAHYIEESGAPFVSDKLHTATLSRGRQAALIEDEAQIPDEYTQMVRKVDAEAVLRALKDGQAVPGAALRNGAPFLRINLARKERAA